MLVVKSGNCIMGIVGQPTPMKDIMGKELFVGDLVKLLFIDDDGKSVNHGLTYVADTLNTFTDGSVSCAGTIKPFIMGIASCKLGERKEYGGYWHVKKVKRYNIKERKGLYTPHTIEDIDMPTSFMRSGY